MIKSSKSDLYTNKLKIGPTFSAEFGTLKKKLNFAPSGMSPFRSKIAIIFVGLFRKRAKIK
jgi:hypothetical protein